MDVLIRTDASIEIGSGHVMRCVTIAELLRGRGCIVTFMMESLPGNLIGYVERKGFRVVQVFQPTDLCIIDHYGIDERWERTIRSNVKKIVVIDDLANRPHDCDMLIDQNVVPDYKRRYDLLVPKHCVRLLGPKYLIMREEFIRKRHLTRIRDGNVQRLLIFMGGSDPTNETMKVLAAMCVLDMNYLQVDVVVGSSNVRKSEIESLCTELGYQFHFQIDYMAELMGQADFSIGAGGSTTWERCYVGLPSSSTVVAENQMVATETAAMLGAVYNLGWHEHVTVDTYKEFIQLLLENQGEWKKMSERGIGLTQTTRPNPWVENIMELIKS
ncbi:UDP-2,4-diacetamido-2,4,6-trideoxy-beta-L-altropyranose hydrolase [Sporosarcina newyorkensis]|nr:UDP-2,4-diacetamido-2,4,6-trideoxy-beta-L-altropyranose hydrolase [Sporosarcina newyorkensis]